MFSSSGSSGSGEARTDGRVRRNPAQADVFVIGVAELKLTELKN